MICLYSGLRIGELLALTWADIDFTKGTLTVNKTCHDGRDENGNLCRITDLPKTTSSKRIIPLPKQLLPVLKEYKRKSISEYVVESEKGEPPTMLFLSRQLMLRKKDVFHNPTIVLITDREDLDTQTSKLFVTAKEYLHDKNIKSISPT